MSPRPAYVASYPPRECGIATFTSDLVHAVDGATGVPGRIAAMNEPGAQRSYPPGVVWQIERDDPASYRRVAAQIAASDVQVVNVQHEYGLFGGDWGSYLIGFLERLTQPVVLTLHTVMPDPDPALRQVTRALLALSTQGVVLAHAAIDILQRDYDIDPRKLAFIAHGVPNVSFPGSLRAKERLGLNGRKVLATCGLINPGKGIEYAIQAMARLVPEFPDVLYLVVGETHPGVRAQAGESYRLELQALVRRLHLDQHVIFLDKYLSYTELVEHLLATDIYLVPYLNLNQIVSGTLAYALGCGCAIVSTPSLYAREVLDDGRGMLVNARDDQALAAAAAGLLRDPEARLRMRSRAYAFGHEMIWSNVARSYARLFQAVSGRRHHAPAVVPAAGRVWTAPTRFDVETHPL